LYGKDFRQRRTASGGIFAKIFANLKSRRLENTEKVAFLKNEQFCDDGKRHTNKFL